MTSCDKDLCINGMTDSDGRYRFSGLGPQPRKMEVIAPDDKLDLIYVQKVGPQHEAKTVALIERTAPPTPWAGETGGTVERLAGGLFLTAQANPLEYSPGADESVTVEVVELDRLPPTSWP